MEEEAKGGEKGGNGNAATEKQNEAAAAPKPKQKEKKVPEGLVIPPKKPKLTKAERRALQEQQRAAKAAGGGGKGGGPPPKQQQGVDGKTADGAKTDGKKPPGQPKAPPSGSTKKGEAGAGRKDSAGPSGPSPDAGRLNKSFVPTLPPFRDPAEIFDTGASLQPLSAAATKGGAHHHPAVLALGYKFATGEIRGGNARCRHMLQCFETVLRDFVPPSSGADAASGTVDNRHVLDQQILKASFQFWTEVCRPHSVSMGNAFTVLKAAVASLDRSLSFDEMRNLLLETIHAYSLERIEYADRAIADLACQKLLSPAQQQGASDSEEVILTFGYSEVVDLTLRQAAASSKNIRVIVVDSQPLLEGRRLLTQLCSAGIECTYVLLNALTYVLQDNVSKVLLGASALMSDGSVWSRAGAACVALAAHAQHIPVLVCSETYKISNRVQLESLTNNELGSPYHRQPEESGHNSSNLKQLDLLYDLTPASFVSGIVTELGIIPPSSVAVLLREMNHPQG